MQKVYVRGYAPRDAAANEKWPFVDNVVVEYSSEPEWKMGYDGLADTELRILKGMNVHVGQHYCDLTVEKLPDGQFGIICANHPPFSGVIR